MLSRLINSVCILCIIIFIQQIHAYDNQNYELSTPSITYIEGHQNASEDLDSSRSIQPLVFHILDDLHSAKQVNESRTLFYKPDQLNGSLADVSRILLTAQSQISALMATFHRYDNENELRLAAGPNVNQELCIKQLEQLNERARVQLKEKYAGRDINFHQLLDTFGRPPSGTLLLNTIWTGMYKECLRLRIDDDKGNKLKTRYCLASFKYKSWLDNQAIGDIIGFESGVCLPESCDSLNYKNKFQLIQKLLDFNARDIDKNETDLNYLYCLPDEESEMRRWWKMPSVIVSLTLITCWLLLLVYCTIRYEKIRKSKKVRSSSEGDLRLELVKNLSVINNYERLIGHSGSQTKRSQPRIVNFQILEGVKVLSLLTVVLAHTGGILVFRHSNNMRELATLDFRNILYLLSITPAFLIVDAFFAIAGMLTAYKIFEKNQAGKIATRPLTWFGLILSRYIRIVPTYALVTLILKYLTVYIGSGPLWDYRTSSDSLRSMCTEESWLWTFLLISNLKPIHTHCVQPAWYLANDFQFLIVAPIFLYVLHKRPFFGKVMILLSMAVSILSCFLLLSRIDGHLIDPLAESTPYIIGPLVETFFPYYSFPHFRIPAFLFGILVGYSLYKFEQKKIKNQEKSKECSSLDKEDWPLLRRYDKFMSLVLLSICFALPILSSFSPPGDYYGRILFTFMWPNLHLLTPIALALYILSAVTGYGNRFVDKFLSASFWSILAKLNLVVLITHIEVAFFVFQSRNHLLPISFETHLEAYLLCVPLAYIVAFIIHLLIEAPMTCALNSLMGRIFKIQPQEKKDQHEMMASATQEVVIVSPNQEN